MHCRRTLQLILDGRYVQLIAHWEYGAIEKRRDYDELALIGVGEDGVVSFWSFTSDGKRSTGRLADVSDIHPEAVGFEAQMDAGLARAAYWPAEDGGYYWAVESRSKKGWNRFVEHHYQRRCDRTPELDYHPTFIFQLRGELPPNHILSSFKTCR